MKKLLILVLVSLTFTACGEAEEPSKDGISKSEAASLMAKSDNSRDYCDFYGWYGDGICDEFCALPDPDCGPIVCPQYAAPMCDPGETIVIQTGADGCDFPVCEPYICPIYAQPLCADGENIVIVTDANGCERPECQPPIACPIYAAPMCADGETIVIRQDSNGCDYPACELITCPAVAAPVCADGERIVIHTDENGCDFPSCEPGQCPIYPSVLCDQGYRLVIRTDADGCDFEDCELANCPMPTPAPECPAGDYVDVQYDDTTGCTTGHICQPCPLVALPPEDYCEPDETLVPRYNVHQCIVGFDCIQ